MTRAPERGRTHLDLPDATRRRSQRLSEDEVKFIRKQSSEMSGPEIARKFFRQFGRDVSPSRVSEIRKGTP